MQKAVEDRRFLDDKSFRLKSQSCCSLKDRVYQKLTKLETANNKGRVIKLDPI